MNLINSLTHHQVKIIKKLNKIRNDSRDTF
jgi:hypothetical protein